MKTFNFSWKSLIFRLGVALVASGLFVGNASAYGWDIPSYDVEMKMRKDGVLEVKEVIVADFSETSKRGIFREIPFKYGDFPNQRSIDISNISIFDGNGDAWNFEVSTDGRYKNIRIGDEDVWWSEPLTYVIQYEVEGMLNSFSESGEFLSEFGWGDGNSFKDELYWNSIGTNWYESPIGKYSVSLDLSEFEEAQIIGMGCFVGAEGEDDGCELVRDGSVIMTSGDELGLARGVTFGVAFEGDVIEPRFNLGLFLQKIQILILAFPLLVFGLFYRHWRKYGKEFDKRAIVPIYKLGKDANPMEVGTLVDEKLDNHDIAAGIVNLAIKGYLRIEEEPKQGFFGSRKTYFIKLKDVDDSLLSFERSLHQGLFAGKGRVETADLEGSFYVTVSSVKSLVFGYLVERGFYKKNPDKVKEGYIGYGILALFVGVWLSSILESVVLAFVFVPIGIGFLFVSPFMSKKTELGIRAYEQILGFKEFVKVAEKDRLKFFQTMKDELAQDDRVRTFEEMLPFAMALGLGDVWSDLFVELFPNDYMPLWYSNSSGSFSMNDFSSSMNSLSSSVASASVSPSSSASSGGSFSSGGFSGGGFGGGGGGSW